MDQNGNLNQQDLLSMLDEAYFGKSKELLEIENLLDAYRKKYMENYTMIGAAANTDKMLVKLNRLFEKQFGFGDFALLIADAPISNAFTFAIDSRIENNVSKNKLVNQNTYKFNKEADYACIVGITSMVIFNPRYTNEEIVGIILHEIGHNFFAALSTTNTIFSTCTKAVNIASIPYYLYNILTSDENNFSKVTNAVNVSLGLGVPQINAIMKNVVKGIKMASKHKNDINTAMFNSLSCTYLGLAFYELCKEVVKYGSIFFIGPIKFIEKIAKEWIDDLIDTTRDPIHMLRLPNGFRNERTADNFATMYGYGPALAESFNKMELYDFSPDQLEKLPKMVPFIGCLIDALYLPIRLINNAIDPHPLQIQRTTDQVRMLEEEMKKSNLDPKMKKRIQKDIDNINKSIQASMDTSKNATTDPDFVHHVVNRIMYNTVDGKTIRDIIFNFDPNGKYKSYDKTIDEICQKNKK